jgi:hypothetical protein
MGAGKIQVAKAKKNNSCTPEFLNAITNNEHIEFAIVYDSWFDPALLNKWQKVATWQIENNVICGDATVSFYAVKPAMVSSLKTNLKAYQQSLPADIKVEYF